MDLLEYQGKQLFARHGLKVSSGEAVATVERAVDAANRIGYPVVVKAQVLVGGRGKAGGVKLAADEAQVREHAQRILGMDIRGHVVHTLWIEHASDIAREYYAAVLLDRSAKRRLADRENEDEIERRAAEQGVQYVKLDGDIGILGNGAGLVMSTLDVVAQAGGSPANFLDAGGGSDAQKIKQAVELILANPAVKAVLFNIFGGITRGDEVAKGLITAFRQITPSGPFVVRLDGTNDVEGRRLLAEANLPNVHTARTMDEAARAVVALAAGHGV